MTSIIVSAHAKVNLFLKVLSVRADGYHNILTLFERISLADTIKISKIPKGIIVKSDVFITRSPKDNLVYKAAELILKRGKVRTGVKIEIKKRIPIAAGLGGGSSDAAAALIGINKLFNLRFKDKILISLGKSLGADVPFFISGASFAIGTGRGDNIKVVRSPARFWHLLIYPGFKVATKDVYEAFDETSKRLTLRRGSGSSTELLSRYLTPRPGSVKIHPLSKLRMDYTQIESMLHNDLERVVSLKKGITGGISKSLAQLLGKRAIVSGSGPSLFCLYRTRREAMEAKETILRDLSVSRREGWQVFVA